jgi:hypothetical protein
MYISVSSSPSSRRSRIHGIPLWGESEDTEGRKMIFTQRSPSILEKEIREIRNQVVQNCPS